MKEIMKLKKYFLRNYFELMDNTQQTITKFTDENIITKLKKSKKDYK